MIYVLPTFLSSGHQSMVRYIDNGVIRLGVDLEKGGAIVYLSSEHGKNIINSADLGRQIQLSFYSGPVPYAPDGKQPALSWAGLGWNPIQTGDYYHHPSKVLAFHQTKTSLTVECVPMHWPLNNEPAHCKFLVHIQLKGHQAIVHAEIQNNRRDHTQYPARGQELPAIYTNGPWYRLVSYTGSQPFTMGPVTTITNPPPKSTFPWRPIQATECWTALLDRQNRGIGVIEPGCQHMSGGFFGSPGAGGPHDSPTGYIAPNYVEILDHNITYSFDCRLVVGSLKRIRTDAYRFANISSPAKWTFSHNRQHWYEVHCSDSGWPINGLLNVRLTQNDPQLIGPVGLWKANQFQTVQITAAFHTANPSAVIYWREFGLGGFSDAKSVSFQANEDGLFHVYTIPLPIKVANSKAIRQIRFDPEPTGHSGNWVKIRSIQLESHS